MMPTSSSTHNLTTIRAATSQTRIPRIFAVEDIRTNPAEAIETIRRVRITSCAEFPSAYGHFGNEECPTKIVLDLNQKRAVLNCSVNVNNGTHTHSISYLQLVTKQNDPLADGATQKTQTLSYAEEGLLNLISIDGYKSAILTTTKELELEQSTPCSNLTQEYNPFANATKETVQLPVTCIVENAVHHHTYSIPMYLPLEPEQERTIPVGASSHTQTVTAVGNLISENRDLLHQMVTEKRYRLKLAETVIPQAWTCLSESVQQFYINDIVKCYKLGASLNEISTRHNLEVRHTRAILLLELDKIRTHAEERKHICIKKRRPDVALPSLGEMPPLKQAMQTLPPPTTCSISYLPPQANTLQIPDNIDKLEKNTKKSVEKNAAKVAQMMKRRVRITSFAEYPSTDGRFTNKACSARIVLDLSKKRVVLNCSVNDGAHTHSASSLRFVKEEDDPLADGATRKTQTLSYIEEEASNIMSMNGYKPAILTMTKEFDLPQAEQCSNLTQDYRPLESVTAETIQIPATCDVENSVHHHTCSVSMYLPLEPEQARTIPTGAISFTQIVTPADDFISEDRYLLHELIAEKRNRFKLGRITIPHPWTCLTESMQQFYINDIVKCYELGATCGEIATRHNIEVHHVRAILLMKLDKIRNCTEEQEHINTKKHRPLVVLPTLGEMPPLRQVMQNWSTTVKDKAM